MQNKPTWLFQSHLQLKFNQDMLLYSHITKMNGQAKRTKLYDGKDGPSWNINGNNNKKRYQ